MEQEPKENQDGHEAEEQEVMPKIYVASLSDYNDGRLYGRWLNADQTADELYEAVKSMLDASLMPNAEEWGIFDYEGFGPLRIDEYEDFRTVSMLANGITEHGEAFAHWVDLTSERDENAVTNFQSSYLGCFESLGAYAESLLEDLGYLDMIQPPLPEFLQPYVSIDIESLARDLELSGDVMTAEGSEGVYVFNSTW
jgi:antirestriction protein